MDEIDWLQAFYAEHCNGTWEQHYGLSLDTLDNPGWLLQVDLADTELADKPFVAVEIERSETDWLDCHLSEQQFVAAGGPKNLRELLLIFRAFVEKPAPASP